MEMMMTDMTRLANCDDFGTATGQVNANPVKPMNIGRYVRIVEWARARYTKAGYLVTYVGDTPAPFTRVEQAAWKAYCA